MKVCYLASFYLDLKAFTRRLWMGYALVLLKNFYLLFLIIDDTLGKTFIEVDVNFINVLTINGVLNVNI